MRDFVDTVKAFGREEEAVFMRVTREGVKIIVVLISLVIIFKDQLTSLVESILSKITKQSNSI